MEQELEKILTNMKDAGCEGEALKKAEQLLLKAMRMP